MDIAVDSITPAMLQLWLMAQRFRIMAAKFHEYFRSIRQVFTLGVDAGALEKSRNAAKRPPPNLSGPLSGCRLIRSAGPPASWANHDGSRTPGENSRRTGLGFRPESPQVFTGKTHSRSLARTFDGAIGNPQE